MTVNQTIKNVFPAVAIASVLGIMYWAATGAHDNYKLLFPAVGFLIGWTWSTLNRIKKEGKENEQKRHKRYRSIRRGN